MPCLMLIAFQESLNYSVRSGPAWWPHFQICLFQGLSQLGDLPVAVHFHLKNFLCELSLVFYLPAAAAFYEQYCCLFCCLGHLYW